MPYPDLVITNNDSFNRFLMQTESDKTCHSILKVSADYCISVPTGEHKG